MRKKSSLLLLLVSLSLAACGPGQPFGPTLTPTPTETFTPTATFTHSSTPTPFKAISAGNVWVRPEPDYNGDLRFTVLRRNTPVKVLSVYGVWMEVEWQAEGGLQRGWVPSEWITLFEPVLEDQITPTQTP